jgi:hypothetical protein
MGQMEEVYFDVSQVNQEKFEQFLLDLPHFTVRNNIIFEYYLNQQAEEVFCLGHIEIKDYGLDIYFYGQNVEAVRNYEALALYLLEQGIKLELGPHMLTETIKEHSEIEFYSVHIKPKRKRKKT